MKTTTRIAATAAMTTLATTAFAASERSDASGIWVWGFLAVCAFIIVAQLLPPVLKIHNQTGKAGTPLLRLFLFQSYLIREFFPL